MATCKGCKAQIIWGRRKGKVRSLNPDGSDHGGQCRALRDYYATRPRPVTQQRYASVTPIVSKGTLTIGADYRPSCTVCLPWDDCKHAASTPEAPATAEGMPDEQWNHFLDLIGQP